MKNVKTALVMFLKNVWVFFLSNTMYPGPNLEKVKKMHQSLQQLSWVNRREGNEVTFENINVYYFSDYKMSLNNWVNKTKKHWRKGHPGPQCPIITIVFISSFFVCT